jgi:tripeptide aminopeptidase
MNFDSDIKRDVLDRFLRYVKIDTQSDEQSETYPSTRKQLDLLNLLTEELRGLGLADVRIDEHGYVMATVPSTLPASHAVETPTVGFLAHVDTSPDVSGANVKPQIIERYEGGVIVLPGDPEQKIDPRENPTLEGSKGHTLVTTDGTTLLGGDDKAGVAEIMTAITYLLAHPEIPHGKLAIAFTPDEEVGKGTKYFDLVAFGAAYAYTIDGGERGGIQHETFSADSAEIVIAGRSQHPGYAKGKMVNAIKLAAELIDRLPKDRLSPETTEGREGYVHPVRIQGTVEEARINFILRDFEDEQLFGYRAFLEGLIAEVKKLDERAEISISYSESYRNMREKIREVPFTVEYAEEAIRRAGLEPFSEPVRGGTDGSRLTAMGLPTPNLFTGNENYHSKREWADVDDMVKAVQMIVELTQVWAERGEPRRRER